MTYKKEIIKPDIEILVVVNSVLMYHKMTSSIVWALKNSYDDKINTYMISEVSIINVKLNNIRVHW